MAMRVLELIRECQTEQGALLRDFLGIVMDYGCYVYAAREIDAERLRGELEASANHGCCLCFTEIDERGHDFTFVVSLIPPVGDYLPLWLAGQHGARVIYRLLEEQWSEINP